MRPGLVGDRAGERAALVAEQLGLEELIGKRRAVDGDERPLAAARRVMNEPGDDFLAGSRLAGQQHRGLGVGDARGVREHVLPLLRLSDDAPLTGARLELASQRGHLRFEPRGRLARFGLAARRLGQPLVRQRQRQVVGHAPREVDIVLAERIGVAGQEEERAEDLGAERHRHAQRRPHAEAAEDLAADAVGRDLGVGVVDDVGVAIRAARGRRRSAAGAREARHRSSAPAIA